MRADRALLPAVVSSAQPAVAGPVRAGECRSETGSLEPIRACTEIT